jgi:glyoxylase-like metal-dependent hydrolase (beta-lactamase superfamily II)
MPVQVHGISVGMARAYLIQGDGGWVLVDAGLPGCHRPVWQHMRALGCRDLALIYITHAHVDHYGSAAHLRRLTGAPIAVHAADAETMADGKTPIGSGRGRGKIVEMLWPLLERYVRVPPAPADRLLRDGDSLYEYGLRASVLHTPGHTPGSSCLLFEGGIAFAGDLLTSFGWPRVQRVYATDWSLIPTSLRCLQAARPRLVYTGHGSRPVSGEQLDRLLAQGK